MHWEHVYDVATMSEAPRTALVWSLGIAALGGAWAELLRARGHAVHSVPKWILGVAALMGVVAALTYYEQRRIAARTDLAAAEGPIVGLWREAERTRDANGKWNTTYWEGFWVGGVGFVYATDVEQNYFHNGGSRAIELREGMPVRLRYLAERDGGKTYNKIVRFERLARRD